MAFWQTELAPSPLSQTPTSACQCQLHTARKDDVPTHHTFTVHVGHNMAFPLAIFLLILLH